MDEGHHAVTEDEVLVYRIAVVRDRWLEGFVMTKSRLLDVLEVKKRRLEEITALRRRMLEKTSSASTLTRRLLPNKKPAKTRIGRKRLASEKQHFYLIGCAVDEQFRKFDPAFKLLRQLKIIHGNDLNTLRNELAKRHFAPKEIDALLYARTPMGAAKTLVAHSLANPKHPNGLSLQTIHSSYSRYLRVLKT